MKKVLYMSICASLAIVAVSGCATAPKAMSDTEVIQKLMNDCAAVANAKDIDKLMAYVSDNFTSPVAYDKPGFKEFLENAKEMGYLDGIKIDINDAKITVQATTATITPIHVNGSFGAPEATFTATKEKAGWKITAMEISGI